MVFNKISKNMTPGQRKKVHVIIHGASASAAAVGGGLANIPGSDAPVLLSIQTGMIIAIGKVFGKKLNETLAESIIADFLGVSVGKTLANLLTGWLPGIGNGINATTAAGLTEIIGWTVANDYANETETLDPESLEIIKDKAGGLFDSLKKKASSGATPGKKGIFKK